MKNSVKVLLCILLLFVLVQAVQAAETYVFVTKWGIYGSGDGEFYYPLSVAVDSSGNVYVADAYNNRVQKFSSDGTFLAKWGGTQGSEDGQFYHPYGVAVDSSGNVYVADTGNSRIQKFSSDGTFLAKWGGTRGSEDGQFNNPYGVAVDSSGNLYIADFDNGRIQKISSTGTFIKKWGISASAYGQNFYPHGVAVDSSGNIYVADKGNNRIRKFSSDVTQMFNSDVTFLATWWGTQGSEDGQLQYPEGVAVDSSGNIYVADTFNHRIQKFGQNGTFLAKWGGTRGSEDGQFVYPAGVAVDSSGNVYVADSNNHRIQKFAPAQSLIAVSSITPSTAINTSAVRITDLIGTGFMSGATVKLTKTGRPDITATGISVVSPTKITCTFDLIGKEAGQWNVVVTNPDGTSATLPAGFTITGVVPPTLSVTAISPSTGTNDQSISATVTGTGFKTGAVVKLTLTGQPDIVASGVTLTGDSRITCTFNLTEKITGQWNIVVTHPDGTSAMLPHGFIIIPQPPQPVYITGSWNIGGPDGVWGFGNCMALRQSQNQVTGNYTHEQGIVTGIVTGNTFSGVWAEAPTYTGEKDSGKFVVTISSDGNSFSGTFGYGNSSTGYSWNGTNSSAVCLVTDVKPLSVTTISPSTGTNDQSISATVTGTGFKTGAVVKLTLTGQPDIVASGVTLTGDSTIACRFDLIGKTPGTWDLVVTNPGDGTTSVHSTAFTLTAPLITNTTGMIIVSSTPPDAHVYLDGTLKGTGSFTLQDVSPGYHSVRVTKTLYNDYGTDVRVVAGSPSYVNAVLTPVNGTSGIIIASSNPAGASVYLDGMDKGISPVTITGVSSGSHTVSFTKTGYTTASRSVTMTAGQTMDITVDLTKTGGDLGDLLNTTTLIIVGIVVLIIIIIGVLLRKKKNRWENY